MKALFSLSAAGALALAVAAWGDRGDRADGGADAVTADAGADLAASPAAEGAMPGGAQGFVTQAAASDMYEIEAGKLAQANGNSQAVKDFGAMLVAEHTKSSGELKAAAKNAPGATAPATLPSDKQAQLDALKKAGENFDKVFKEQQVSAHSATLALLEAYASNGDNEALKGFAAKTAPVVEKHLEAARKLP